MQRATWSADLGDPALAHAVAGAVAAEQSDMGEGARVRIRADGPQVHVEAEAATVSSLRAALNSVVRLVDAAARTAQATR